MRGCSRARGNFALPEADKLAVQMVHSPHFRGYNRAAAELTRGQPDWREQFDIGAERPALTLSDDTRAGRCRPNQWPAALPTLKPLLLQWQQAMTAMSLRLLRAFALALSLPEQAFDRLYGDKPNEHIKLIRYPGGTLPPAHRASARTRTPGFSASCCRTSKKGCRWR